MRNVFRLLDERGGLKAIEERLGFGRPAHLKGVSGTDAIVDWNSFRRSRDVKALWRLLEYNLYDVVQMRSLAEVACERLAQRSGRIWVPRERFHRGDILVDMGIVDRRAVEEAYRLNPRGRVGELLLKNGLVDEKQLFVALTGDRFVEVYDLTKPKPVLVTSIKTAIGSRPSDAVTAE